jgi:hypothetical protein
MKVGMVMLCLVLGVVLAAGPANAPVSARVVNDVNPAAQPRAPYGTFCTTDDPPTKEWGRQLTTAYSVGVTPVQDTLMWVSCGQSEESIYVYKLNDPARPLVDAFPQTNGPSGWGIRDMAWKASTNEVFAGFDGQKFHVYDATSHEPNNTYTVSGYVGVVRGFGYSPFEDSCWTCDFSTSPMAKFSITGTNGHPVRAANQMASAYGIAVDTVQRCFWVTQTGTAGASPTWKMDFNYNVTDSFNAAGWDAGGGCEMWRDTFLLQLEQSTTDEVFCMRFSLAPAPNHDVGATSIVAPASHIGSAPVQPKASIRNFGRNPEMNIPVTCWIDSGPTRVYSADTVIPGPVPPRSPASVTFSPSWYPGPVGASYTVTVFTALAGDANPDNDTVVGQTAVSGAVFSDTIRVRRLDQFAPTIDGNMTPGEWSTSVMYDISDLAGRGGNAQPAGSCIAYYLYDFAEGFMYYGVDCPFSTARTDYDQFGPYMDEDRNAKWSADSSEGNHYVEYVAPNDEVLYRAVLDTSANVVWEMGLTPGAQSASSLASGHLQFEAKIPIGSDKWSYSIETGDTVGYFQYAAVTGGGNYIGWWPQTLRSTNWANPVYYGPMILDSVVQGIDGLRPTTPYALYKASPSLVQDFANIRYYLGRQAHVELGVYNATGSLVKNLAGGILTPGERTVTWNRTDNSGRRVPSGTYFYRLAVDGEAVSGKAVVLK